MGKDSLKYSRREKATQVEKDKGKSKVVAKPKKDMPRRSNAPLVINEGGSRRSQAQVVRERESSSETETDNSIEDNVVPTTKDKETEVSPSMYQAALAKCTIMQTRWPDVALLARLGLLEDVRKVLRGMGFERVLEMNYECYPKQVLALLSTFEVHFKRAPKRVRDIGYVSFQVNRKRYTLDFEQVCGAYGFPLQLLRRFPTWEPSDSNVWDMIGQGYYSPGKNKASHISNPAIRYIHKILANTIFARFEGDRVIEDEMAMLTNGLLPMFKDEFKREQING